MYLLFVVFGRTGMTNVDVSSQKQVIYQQEQCVGCTPTNGNLESTVRFVDDVTGTEPYRKNIASAV